MQIVTIKPKNGGESARNCWNAAYRIYVDMFNKPFTEAPTLVNGNICFKTEEEVNSEILKQITAACRDNASEVFLTIKKQEEPEYDLDTIF